MSSSAPYARTLSACVRPSMLETSPTPIQNNRQHYSSVYLYFCIFGEQSGRQRILHRLIASIPWLQSALNFSKLQTAFQSTETQERPGPFVDSGLQGCHTLSCRRTPAFPSSGSEVSGAAVVSYVTYTASQPRRQ